MTYVVLAFFVITLIGAQVSSGHSPQQTLPTYTIEQIKTKTENAMQGIYSLTWGVQRGDVFTFTITPTIDDKSLWPLVMTKQLTTDVEIDISIVSTNSNYIPTYYDVLWRHYDEAVNVRVSRIGVGHESLSSYLHPYYQSLFAQLELELYNDTTSGGGLILPTNLMDALAREFGHGFRHSEITEYYSITYEVRFTASEMQILTIVNYPETSWEEGYEDIGLSLDTFEECRIYDRNIGIINHWEYYVRYLVDKETAEAFGETVAEMNDLTPTTPEEAATKMLILRAAELGIASPGMHDLRLALERQSGKTRDPGGYLHVGTPGFTLFGGLAATTVAVLLTRIWANRKRVP